jgi:hypothetical protein
MTPTDATPACAFEACGHPAKTKGLCKTHYMQQWRGESLRPVKRLPPRGCDTPGCDGTDCQGHLPYAAEAHIDRQADGCWIWTAARNPGGYGITKRKKDGTSLAHRWVYELLAGPIPPGLHIDHLCKTKACVNPAHLEPITQAEHNRREPTPPRTHCPHGHPYNQTNTYHHKGKRYCKTCLNERSRTYQRKRRAALKHPIDHATTQ